MRVQCEKCKAEYQIDDERIPPQGAKIRCPRCSSVFVVTKAKTEPEQDDIQLELDSGYEPAPPSDTNLPDLPEVPNLPPPPVFASEPEPETTTASTLPPLGSMSEDPFADDPSVPELPAVLSSVEPDRETEGEFFTLENQGTPERAQDNLEPRLRYRIRRKSGKVFGPFDMETVAKMLAEHKLASNEDASTDGKIYRPLKSFNEFAELLVTIPQQPQETARPSSKPPQSTLEQHQGTPGIADELEAKSFVQSKLVAYLKRPGMKPRIAAGGVLLAVLVLGVVLGLTKHGFFAHRSISQWIGSSSGVEEKGKINSQDTGGAGDTGVGETSGLQTDFNELFRRDIFTDYQTLINQGEKHLKDDKLDLEELHLLGLSYAALLRNHGANEHYLKQGWAVLRQMKNRFENKAQTKKVEAALIMLTDPAKASALLRPLVSGQPANQEALYLAGWAASYQKKWREAASFFTRAADIDPGFAKVYHSLGDIHSLQGDFDKALLFYQQAIEKVPHRLQSLLAMTRIYIEVKENFEKSGELTSQLVGERLQTLSSTEQASVHSLKAKLSLHLRQPDKAIYELQQAVQLAPSRHEYAAELGNLYMQASDYPKALTTFDKILKLEPDSLEAKIGKGRAIWKNGDIVQAKLLLEKAAAQTKTDPRPNYLLGRIAEDLAKPKEAMTLYRKAIRVAKTYLEPQVAIAKLHMKAGRIKKAFQQLSKAGKSAPDSALIRQGLGEIYLLQGKLEPAKAEFEQALALEPQMPAALFHLARVLMDLNQIKESLRVFEKLQEVSPKYPDLALEYGYTLYLDKNYPESLKVYEEAIRESSKNDRLFVRAALVANAIGDTQKAVQFLQTATGLSRNNADAFLQLGIIFERQKRHEEALELFRRAAELNPKNPEIHYHMGLCYLGLEMSMDAIEALQEATKIKPNHVEASIELGKALSSKYRHSEAIEQLKRAVRIQPKRLDLLLALGDAYQQRSANKKALKVFRQAFNIDPQAPGLAYRLGRTYDELEQRKQATKFYLKAVKNQPEDPMPHFYLGYIYKARVQNRKSVAEFEQYLRLKPDALDADEIRMEIEYLKND